MGMLSLLSSLAVWGNLTGTTESDHPMSSKIGCLPSVCERNHLCTSETTNKIAFSRESTISTSWGTTYTAWIGACFKTGSEAAWIAECHWTPSGRLEVQCQHCTVLSARSPQEWKSPDEMAVNRSLGEFARPLSQSPQHSVVPSTRIPHESCSPADTAVNAPLGASSWPWRLSPQHSIVMSTRIPHE